MDISAHVDMSETSIMESFVSEEVVLMMACLTKQGKVYQDYRIHGNERGTTIIIRFCDPSSHGKYTST